MKKYKIYTKGGDRGKTSLLGGARVDKFHPRVEAYGTIDELVSYLGYLRDHIENIEYVEKITRIQNSLLRIASIVAVIDKKLESKLAKVDEKEIDFIEKWIDEMDNSLPPLTSFIIPGGHKVVSLCHITRTICRRAERKILYVNQSEILDPIIIKYVNRLSDLFFVFARKLAFDYDIKTLKADL